MTTLFRLTLREILNKKIFLIASVISVIFLVLYGVLLNFTVGSIHSAPPQNLAKAMLYPQLYTLGLYFASFLVNVFAIFISVGTISAEIENGLMHAVVTKPIHRAGILLGKYLGYCFTVVMFSGLLFTAILILTSSLCGYTPDRVLAGGGLFILQPLILLTLTIWGSTFLSTMANGITVIMLYVLATVGGMAENIGGFISNRSLINTGIITSLLVPTDATYRKMINVMVETGSNPLNAVSFTPFGSVSPPSGIMVGYAVMYVLFFICMAAYVFARRDL